ncbi:hypothetical protein ACHAWO_010820 [Cyclotella atomus]|uniref:Uncharacterized protein n=1 Tax=Cyclotella atomus TaxID=382360 RepID=A0ABD3P3V1_9STRA
MAPPTMPIPAHRKRGRRPGCTICSIQLLVGALISVAIALLLTAFHLTQQLAHKRPPPSSGIIKSRITQSPYDPWPAIPQVASPDRTPGVLRSSGKYAHNRVYCMVPFVWRKDFYDIIMATWGSRCDQIYFFTDSVVNLDGGIVRDFITGNQSSFLPYWEYPAGSFPENVVFVNMTRSWDGCTDAKTGKPKICRHIWEKMWRSWLYVADHHSHTAEWFCKIDYDSFFFPENLQYYVQDYKSWNAKTEHHYFGHHLFHREIIAGPCACWSHKTLVDIANVYRSMPKGYSGNERNKCEDRAGATEEVSTSKCLKYELGVLPEDALDDHHRDFVMLDPFENHLEWNRTKQGEWWFWKGKEAERGQMEECCAHRPIAFHKYKFPGQHRQLNEQFYGKEGNKDITKMKEREIRYIEKVRKAMGIDTT